MIVRTRPRQRLAGFTLIELLVVISIIALLIGILVPTLSGTRETARRTKCLVNLRSLGQAMQLYMQTEGRDLLPNTRPLAGDEQIPGDLSLTDVLATYIDAPKPRKEGDAFIAVEPYRCPSDTQFIKGQTVSMSTGTSYEYGPGLAMTFAETFLSRDPRLCVTKALESRPDWPVLYDAGDWHNLRAGGKVKRNGTFIGDWHCDWMPFIPSWKLGDFWTEVIGCMTQKKV